MVSTKVNIAGVQLSNPVIPASGTFGFGLEMAGFYDLNVLGGISLKGSTLEPRFGNECPRIAECEGGLLNSVGLQNPGVDALVSEKIPALRKIYKGAVIANISGFGIDEYAACCKKVAPVADIIELNISCPNVHGGGMAFGTDPKAAAEVTKAAKEAIEASGSKTPLCVKLSPNVTSIVDIAKAVEDAGADALTLINTILGMRIDLRTRKPILAAGYGGFSGRAVFPIALRMVNQVSRACSIPVIGCGGVASASDVLEMMMAGARAVQIGSENLRNPMCCKQIVEELPALMQSLRIHSLEEL